MRGLGHSCGELDLPYDQSSIGIAWVFILEICQVDRGAAQNARLYHQKLDQHREEEPGSSRGNPHLGVE